MIAIIVSARVGPSPRRALFELLFNEAVIQRVTFLKPTLKPADCFRVAQDLLGPQEIYPAKPKPTFGRSQTASENVIQSVEIVSPFISGNYACRNFSPKAAQTIEFGTVDFNGGL
jgi:hypothetical protein